MVHIQVLSDLHLEQRPYQVVMDPETQVCLILGDIHDNPMEFGVFIHSLSAKYPVVEFVLVLGNHEFDRKIYYDVLPQYRQYVEGLENVHLLEKEVFTYNDVNFFGTSLWADGMSAEVRGPDGKWMNAITKYLASGAAQWIKLQDPLEFINVEDFKAFHLEAVEWLDDTLPLYPNYKKNIVVTHYLPSRMCKHPTLFASNMHGFFYSNLEWLMNKHRPRYWVCGHIHESQEVTINQTKIILNARGRLLRDGIPDNPNFKDVKIIKV